MYATVRVLSHRGPIRVELARWGEQLVAIKHFQGGSPPLAERLYREGQVVKKLNHENIVPLLATDEDRLIYAYCAGVSLATALMAGPLKLKLALKFITDVLRALDYAHGLGVIHFDVKPANIIVRGDSALLTDFGFAKDLALTAITHQGMLLGTPNYMAPEQFRGNRSDLRSDLYPVGAVLYHMLTGAPPYGSQVMKVLTGDTTVPLPPLTGEASCLNEVVRTALSSHPWERYPSAAAMLAAIGRCRCDPVL
jgi:serine/threonine protein kinase